MNRLEDSRNKGKRPSKQSNKARGLINKCWKPTLENSEEMTVQNETVIL